MHPKTFCSFFLVLVAVSGYAGPNRIAVVPASGRAALAQLAASGVLEYARTDGHVFAAPAAVPSSVLSAGEVSLDPTRHTYLVYAAHARAQLPGLVCWRDGSTVLMQLSMAEAEAVARLGGELQLLPDEPHPIRLAPERSFPHQLVADTLITRLLASVSADSIRQQVQRLQDFRTRYSMAESCRAAEQYVFDYFTALGMDSVQLDTYVVWGETARNVIGTKVGRRDPEKIAIICGHMDATSQDQWNSAPGAEDNASGTVMAIEAARVLATEDFDQTVKFIAFTGEEQGLVGSYHYAQAMQNMNADITGVLNFDMIAWPGGRFGVSLFCDEGFRGFRGHNT